MNRVVRLSRASSADPAHMPPTNTPLPLMDDHWAAKSSSSPSPSPSVSAIARPSGHRAAGSFASARDTAASMSAGTSGTRALSGGGAFVTCCTITSRNDAPSNGNRPLSIAYPMMPSE